MAPCRIFCRGLSPIAESSLEVTNWAVGARLIGWRPVLAKSPLCCRVSAGFNKGGVPPTSLLHSGRKASVGARLLIRREIPAYIAASLYIGLPKVAKRPICVNALYIRV